MPLLIVFRFATEKPLVLPVRTKAQVGPVIGWLIVPVLEIVVIEVLLLPGPKQAETLERVPRRVFRLRRSLMPSPSLTESEQQARLFLSIMWLLFVVP